MKTKWYSLLLLGLALLLSSSVVSCGETYTTQDLNVARELAYAQGQLAGRAEIKTAKEQAFKNGYESGYLEGEKESYDIGYKDGYDNGWKESEQVTTSALNEASELGYDRGYEVGYEEGYRERAKLPAQEPVTPPEEGQVIEDLAYIRAFSMPYSDDADPEWEGVSIRVSYYNSKSERITPSGVSVEVTVELYWYTKYPPIYQEQVTINYTGALTEFLKEVIRIPFDIIERRPSGSSRSPTLDVVVTTPTQGDFEDLGGLLYWP